MSDPILFSYLAGLFDGEGSFSIQVNTRYSTNGVPSPHFNFRMTMVLKPRHGCSDEALNMLAEAFGGKIYERKSGTKQWSLGKRKDLEYAISCMLPYFVIKKDIATRFSEALDVMPRTRKAHSAGERSWTPGMILKVADIALTLNPPSARTSQKTLDFVKELKRTFLPCVWCGHELGDAEYSNPALTRCRCGVVYATDLIEEADVDEWLTICARGGYDVRRDGSTVIVTKLENKNADGGIH